LASFSVYPRTAGPPQAQDAANNGTEGSRCAVASRRASRRSAGARLLYTGPAPSFSGTLAAATPRAATGSASDLPVDAVAARSGFGSADNFRKHFARVLRTSPQAYRRSFRQQRGG